MKTPLSLGFLSNTSGLAWFELQGAGMLPGMLGCEWEMQTGSGERVAEKAIVSLRGSLQELKAVTEGFESLRSHHSFSVRYNLLVWERSSVGRAADS